MSNQKTDKNLSFDEFKSEISKSLTNIWKTDRKPALQLSGGIDSSLIASLSHEMMTKNDIPTISVLIDDRNRKFWKPRSEKIY